MLELFTNGLTTVNPSLLTVVISAVVSATVAWITHLRATVPTLVFMRRPDWNWKIRNVGRGTAYDIQFEDRKSDGKYKRYFLDPIGPGDEAPLGELSHGDQFTLYYSGASTWQNYKTSCRGCRNKVRKVKLWLPTWKDCEDETRARSSGG
jgi:hypothetical protein